MPHRGGTGVCDGAGVMMLPPIVLYEFVAAVDLHRDTLASLVPGEAGVPIWALVSTTMPIANRGPAGVLRALEELPASLVAEISDALVGRLRVVGRGDAPGSTCLVRRSGHPRLPGQGGARPRRHRALHRLHSDGGPRVSDGGNDRRLPVVAVGVA